MSLMAFNLRVLFCLPFFVFIIVGCFAEEPSPELPTIIVTRIEPQETGFFVLMPSDFGNHGFVSLAEVLTVMPVDLQSRSPKGLIQTDFSLRGLNFEAVPLLLNGKSINDIQTGHHNCDIPLTLEDIELIKFNAGTIDINIEEKDQE